ncbi:hypothetical protein NE237_026197 [Protea cynaroides]|uniref:PGG domain-containing protein n=1 Tax=Protea cynaroides TaxID=273540 RepID=A0A9Q0K0Y5_9MAGN|nr:hypothetical protein NE237_026197 [Protea cynaroides]
MERRLYDAALEGDEALLFELLQEDTLILDREIPSGDTPLHIAAMLGHVTFAKEILSRKPKLAGEFNFQRRSPLHLSSAKGHLEIVKLLLPINPSVCLACDQDGRTPLHLAAMKDQIEVLNELLKAKPEACWIRDDRGDTIQHLCIRRNSFEALKLLIHSVSDDEFVNLKDDDGNSLLHIAVMNKQLEMLKFLLDCTKVMVNSLNAYGFTALDVLLQSPRDLKDIDILKSLLEAGAMRSKDGNLEKKTNDQISSDPYRLKGSNSEMDPKKKNDWIKKKRNTLMVVASLTATMAFQVGVNPPSGLWQDTSTKLNSQGKPEHQAGFSIMSSNSPVAYDTFLVSNTVGFLASLSIILLLISGMPLNHGFFMWVLMVIMWIVITSIAFTYLISITTFTPDDHTKTLDNIVVVAIFTWIAMMGLLLLVNTIRLVVKLLKKFGGFIMRIIWPSSSRMNRNSNNV